MSSSLLTGVAHNELARKHLQAMPEAVFLVDVESPAILASKTQAALMTGPPRAEFLNQLPQSTRSKPFLNRKTEIDKYAHESVSRIIGRR